MLLANIEPEVTSEAEVIRSVDRKELQCIVNRIWKRKVICKAMPP